jgi:hypothetical protein
MPKLVHKKEITRLKNFNYTERHDELVKNVEKAKAGKANFRTPEDLLMASGYTTSSAISTLATKSRAKSIAELLDDIWPAEQVLDDLQRITKKAENIDKLDTALKGLDMRIKMGGDYAAQKVEHSGTVEHEHVVTLGKSDYLEFKKKQLQGREYIDGEIVGS